MPPRLQPRPITLLAAISLSTCGSFACAAPTTPPAVSQTITSPLGHPMSLAFDDEFDAVKDKDGQPDIDSLLHSPVPN